MARKKPSAGIGTNPVPFGMSNKQMKNLLPTLIAALGYPTAIRAETIVVPTPARFSYESETVKQTAKLIKE